MPTPSTKISTQWTTEGFMQRFEELLPGCLTYLEAYAATEHEHLTTFGHERFKNYDSFRQCRKNYLIKK